MVHIINDLIKNPFICFIFMSFFIFIVYFDLAKTVKLDQ
jgi:hypothetical protein